MNTPLPIAIGMPGWIELAVIVLVLLVLFGPKLLDFLARRSVERQHYR